MKKTKEEKGKQVMTDAKGLKALAKTLGASLYTDPDGKIRVRSDVAETPEHGVAVSRAVKVLRALAKADAFACVDDGRLFHNAEFSTQARHAVFNSRLLAAGKKGVLK